MGYVFLYFLALFRQKRAFAALLTIEKGDYGVKALANIGRTHSNTNVSVIPGWGWGWEGTKWLPGLRESLTQTKLKAFRQIPME
jgi:hypothetical protein